MPDGGVPSNWWFTNEILAGGAGITVPAPAANVSRVLTHVLARIQMFNGGGIGAVPFQVLDGAVVRMQWTLVTESLVGPPSTVGVDEFDEDVIIQCAPGAVLSVGATATLGANTRQQLMIRGYDL